MNFSHAMTLTGVVIEDGFVRPGLVGAVEGLVKGTGSEKICVDYFPGKVAEEVAKRTSANYQRIEIGSCDLKSFRTNSREWIQGYFTHVVPVADFDHIVVLGIPSMVEPVIRAFLSERSSIIPLVDKLEFCPGNYVRLVFPPHSRRQAPKLSFGTYFSYPSAEAAVA